VAVALIDIITPTLSRADRLAGHVANVHEATIVDWVITFVVEADDTDSRVAVEELAGHPVFGRHVRFLINERTRNCAGAFNTGVAASDATYWFQGGDDVRYHPGWDVKTVALMGDDVKVVGTNDLTGHPEVLAGTAATHFLVDRQYTVEVGCTWDLGPGVAGFEGYHHLAFDSEIVGVARARGVFAPCLDAVVEHVHPSAGKAQADDLYQHNWSRQAFDVAVFDIRRTMWEAPR
jgi:glycosyltransferase involved in cell wall biosynthesis